MRIAGQIVPIAVLAVVMMMILPLPNALLDLLLCANLGFSVALILSAATLSQPERFTALPSILLLTTLFRLGLNVSTTRQLLGTGEAPDIVSAFGLFVIGGNIAVGVVVFLIVTLIQFIVISKGAERVAEVAARFALDAMPGKQMSIDADLRSGALSLSEAREKRLDLQRESRLYGSLDGAMKFIKGDAIAGLVITAVNIIAGVLIGIAVHKYSFQEALNRYTLYTIGDGLVSQLPALLVSIAAGLVVTRVSERQDSLVGEDLVAQLSRGPGVLGLTGLSLLLLSLLPGLPVFALLCCSSFAFIGAVKRRALLVSSPKEDRVFIPRGVPLLSLRVSSSVLDRLRGEEFVSFVAQTRKSLYEGDGLVITEPELEVVRDDWCLQFLISGEVVWSVSSPADDITGILKEGFREVLAKRRMEFLNDTQTRLILDANEGRCPDLINSVIPGVLSITELTKLFVMLAREDVPIRDVPGILQGILEADVEGSLEQRRYKYLASIRRRLKRSISNRLRSVDLNNGAQDLSAITLSDEIESLLARILLSQTPLSAEFAARIKEAVLEGSRVYDVRILLAGEITREFLSHLVEIDGELLMSVVCRAEVEGPITIMGEVRLDERSQSMLKAA